MQSFIQQANQLGSQRQPFFFLIDFEKKKPVICKISEASTKGIYFAFGQQSNFSCSSENLPPLTLEKFPISLAQYQQAFQQVQTELQKGNSYLLNLTHQTKIKTNYSLSQIFQHCNAPYKLLLEKQFVCFSPECFVNIAHNQISTFPMKGTINANIANAEQVLLNDPKEQAEHYTIVDLMRNDLAMVANNIMVHHFRYLDYIQTSQGQILQTSSEICGKLNANWQSQIGEILNKLLPAGSISGAPKEKTLSIIQQTEQQSRGYYTGVFGIFNGDSLQSAVAIRFIEQQGKELYFRSGGGITIQSEVNAEYKELIEKVYLPISR